MPIESIVKLIDFLIARGIDAAKWHANRAALKGRLEEWNAAGTEPTDEDFTALLDAIDANSAIIRDS